MQKKKVFNKEPQEEDYAFHIHLVYLFLMKKLYFVLFLYIYYFFLKDYLYFCKQMEKDSIKSKRYALLAHWEPENF